MTNLEEAITELSELIDGLVKTEKMNCEITVFHGRDGEVAPLTERLKRIAVLLRAELQRQHDARMKLIGWRNHAAFCFKLDSNSYSEARRDAFEIALQFFPRIRQHPTPDLLRLWREMGAW
jgi:hypothetical protein